MTFGLTANGFKIKRLDDIITEIEARYKVKFGDGIDLSSGSPAGQEIAIYSDREAEVWEVLQDIYNSQYPASSEGKQLDNVVALTGTTRRGPEFSKVITGIARGDNGTIIEDGKIVSVAGNPTARFIVQGNYVINVVDGGTFKVENISLVAETEGPVQANTGTLTVIETPVAGWNSFTNTLDADLGSETEEDPELKARRSGELQIAGSCTIEAILSELRARELVEAVIVFQNKTAIEDSDGRPPKSLDIVVLGDVDQDLADAIFLVAGGGIETIGDVSKNVIDSQGFTQVTKFSRPTGVNVWIESDITTDPNFYPVDGDDQVEAALLEYGLTLGVGQDIIVFGSNSLSCVFNSIPGITRFEIRIGKTVSPTTDDNVIIEPREIGEFDSSRITIVSV